VGGSASSTAVRRLRRDLENLQHGIPHIAVKPSEENLLEWHFALHTLPEDTPYHLGCYHGKILFPAEYPHAPPAIIMVTPSGRLEIGKRLCLSMTDFHPESWNPAWSVETILVGLLSFFISAENGYGAIKSSDQVRRQMAEASWAVNRRDEEFCSLFPEMLRSSHMQAAAAADLVRPPDPQASSLQIGESDAVPGGATSDTPLLAVSTHLLGVLGPSAREEVSETAGERTVNEEERGVVANTDDDEAGECWICRDSSSNEPLIQPCACQGSMSGVHATCVEEWIRHHRRNAVNDELPRCSVCHQTYEGYQRLPGVGHFLRHMAVDALKQIVRTVVIVVALVCYLISAIPYDPDGSKVKLPMVVRVVLISLFFVASLYKVALIAISVPPHRPPPRSACLRRYFFVSDFKSLVMHWAEVFSSVVILTFWFVMGVLPLVFFLPFPLLALVPSIRMCLGAPSLECLRLALMVTRAMITTPCVALWLLVTRAWRNPRGCLRTARKCLLMMVHPLDAGLHIIVAVVSLVLCLCCSSNVPVLVLWGVHGTLVSVGLLEAVFVKKWRWTNGPLWWLSLQFCALAGYIADSICTFPNGLGDPQEDSVVRWLSVPWVALFAGLTLATNWQFIVGYYRTWQHQHGEFTLATEPAGTSVAPAEGVSV